MNPILRNVLALVAGLIVGMVINYGIILLNNSIVSMPDGVDLSDTESLKANIHLFKPKHYIGPFLAHALGTLVGAYTAVRIAVSHKMILALIIGAFFLMGGVMMAQMLDAPFWSEAMDVLLAYLPMAYLGGKMASRN